MKTRLLITSALIGLGIISQVGAAPNVVFVTGSTAYRSAVFAAVKALFDGGNPDFASRDGSHSNGDNANWMLFHGTISAAETFVTCHWSGSEAGIASVAQPGSHPTFYLKTDGTVAYTSLTTFPSSSETNTSASTSDLAFADSSQAVSLTPSPALVAMGTGTPAGSVGVVPFTWAKNNNNASASNEWAHLTNITDAQARDALTGPNIAALFTGNVSDTNQFVYVVGRNNGSGTRVDCLAACRYGITKPVDQWFIGGNPSDGTTLSLTEAINDGYNSGSDVASALKIPGSCAQTDPNFGNSGWVAIGYLGISDAKTLVSNGGVLLTLNGIAESNGAVEEGQYNFWNYEHEYGRVGISGFTQTFGNNLAAGIPSQIGGSNPANQDTGIRLSFMNATKPSDVGDPAHN